MRVEYLLLHPDQFFRGIFLGAGGENAIPEPIDCILGGMVFRPALDIVESLVGVAVFNRHRTGTAAFRETFLCLEDMLDLMGDGASPPDIAKPIVHADDPRHRVEAAALGCAHVLKLDFDDAQLGVIPEERRVVEDVGEIAVFLHYRGQTVIDLVLPIPTIFIDISLFF